MAETLHSTHEWLDAVAQHLDADPALVRELVGDILDLTAAVAHNGPSRPAAPTTAFVVGLAAGQRFGALGGSADEVREMITQVEHLLDTYEPESGTEA
ncbi:hypothetical protein JKI95_04890 [Corynebacterium aquatimens]|uniref:DUF6457 domain-containing protein n=1 Tax=Corynebacterium TaxID=1716 RepID=UPI001F43F3B3|nr:MULTISPECIES: DUF6457 domain-containing protein [Corynebacterium]QYH20251.1 hypothetical protein JKI95_04890 [Corynebacterium aquatimens]UIZ92483.1 hypothetical protein JZY91_01340 [Corynebacterium sp. CNCTC7651]